MNWFNRNFGSRPKTNNAVDEQRVRDTNLMRFNPLAFATPDSLSRAITNFSAGNLRDLARILDEFETRDDISRASSRKAYTAVSRCPHKVLVVEGYENDPRAKLHQETLTKFWATVRVVDSFARNAEGGIRLLKKNMAAALSQVWSVHEIVWRPQPDGTLQATFARVPLWYFENRSGRLRFLPNDMALEGVDLEPDGWLVCQGDGVGIAAAVAAMSKRLSLQDWLLYSERCGMPGLHATTPSSKGTPEWASLVQSVAAFGREWSIVTGDGVKVTAIDASAKGTLPYPELVSRMDRVIAALYRGADLSTISAEGQKAGASLQGDETAILDTDTCEMISECLQQQVERAVIRWAHGDLEPLAYIQIQPAANPNLELEMKVDDHLGRFGVPLSTNEMLQRYGRTEYKSGDKGDSAAVLRPDVRLANESGGSGPAAVNEEEDSNRAYEDVALEAISEASRRNLRPVVDRLAEALSLDDEDEFRKALQSIYDDLPKLIEEAGADKDTADLFERILLGAVQQGESQSKGNRP